MDIKYAREQSGISIQNLTKEDILMQYLFKNQKVSGTINRWVEDTKTENAKKHLKIENHDLPTPEDIKFQKQIKV